MHIFINISYEHSTWAQGSNPCLPVHVVFLLCHMHSMRLSCEHQESQSVCLSVTCLSAHSPFSETRSVCVSLCLCLWLSVSVSLCVSVSDCFFLFLSLSLTLSVDQDVKLSVQWLSTSFHNDHGLIWNQLNAFFYKNFLGHSIPSHQ